MAAGKGGKHRCTDCDLVVVVEDPCGPATCELVCRGVPMKRIDLKSGNEPTASCRVMVDG